ncbi:N-acetylmuramoyl-L-alanine amidase [Nocardioides sp. CFH 31398]|uniref:N-acetylmuramoyl-L-alanine amidase n=1 Tax=Nocardioides sp. CFH 31398 TaxID=2919579 RepID=UPI001F0574CB|nr:N-acetylmuramoyl-L-alanine amidase [Nocardioides sp. CFH 31398]MCH1868385.1 N-acetylmuramoyl-L-alanine amidase [Nocardioides sp. CFH 31398]
MAISWLADVLRGAGVEVVEEGDWLARSAGSSFSPVGVLWHHTAAPSSASNPHPALNICINGRSDLPGPLCHALVDYHGVFHVISANRANHAGRSGGSGPIPAGDGNTLMIGWEIDYAGDGGGGVQQRMTQAQYDASIVATAAVLDRLGRDSSYARGHRETSTTGKIDPSYIDLGSMRADVAAAQGGTPTDPPSEGTQLRATVGNLNVRTQPTTSAAVVASLANGTVMTVQCQAVGEAVTIGGNTSRNWAKITAPASGYVTCHYVETGPNLRVSACPV